MEHLLRIIRTIIPKGVFHTLQPLYHRALASIGAIVYWFPSRHIHVVAITGTKGKTSTAEIVSSILEAAGYKTALAGTLRFKIGDISVPNMYKMTMPGRFFMQRFLRKAVRAGCRFAVIEMTSEGAVQNRHKHIDLDALIFTNISPEHIESHGSFENYVAAKLLLADALSRSPKLTRILVVNGDDKESEKFLSRDIPIKRAFYLRDAGGHKTTDHGVELIYKGVKISSPLRGLFNVYNIMAAATFADAMGIDPEAIKKGVERVTEIRGRAEMIDEGQHFSVVVDYAHTPDSLTALYEAFRSKRKICVLGNTGGGRDTWKRPKMAEIADTYCDEIILTNEDPYDEDPRAIVETMAHAIKKHPPTIIMDRREAIRTAITHATTGDVVLITGKGTDPFIMGKRGSKIPWSDAQVSREELKKILRA